MQLDFLSPESPQNSRAVSLPPFQIVIEENALEAVRNFAIVMVVRGERGFLFQGIKCLQRLSEKRRLFDANGQEVRLMASHISQSLSVTDSDVVVVIDHDYRFGDKSFYLEARALLLATPDAQILQTYRVWKDACKLQGELLQSMGSDNRWRVAEVNSPVVQKPRYAQGGNYGKAIERYRDFLAKHLGLEIRP